MKKFVSIAIAAGVIFSVVSMTSCSKDENENNDNSSQSAVVESSKSVVSQNSKDEISEISVEEKKEITPSQVAEIKNGIMSYRNVPAFTSSAAGINAEEIAKGMTVTLIPESSSNSFYSLTSKQFKNAAEAVGFEKVVVAETDGSSNSYNTALQAAIETSDIIVLLGDINKDLISGSIELAQANGIRVVSAGNVGKDEKDHYVDYTVPINYKLIGQVLADWCIVHNNGRVNALAINNSESTLSTSIYKGFSAEFEKYVTSGYCSILSGTNIEIENGLATKIKDAISKDPNLNYIVVLDEAMINDAVSGVEQSGKNIKIISTGGMLESYDIAEDGKIEMLVAQSYEWTGYGVVDYVLRILGKSTLPQEEDVPFRTVSADIIKKALKDYGDDDIDGFHEICFGSDFLTGYRGLWDI